MQTSKADGASRAHLSAQIAAARAGVLVLSVLSGCSDGGVANPSDDHEPTREALRELRYDERAKPSDPSNRFVGNRKAIELGRRLFFDTSLSGPLIDGDNDGSGGTLGEMGQAGKVSCASCHIPEDGFVDTRSPHQQISLAAMWTARRTPTLLDVAFAPLFNWDGRRDSLWGQAVGVMESHVEFNSSRLFVATQIFENHRDEYEQVFSDISALSDEARFVRLSPEEAGCREMIRATGPEYVCRGKPGDNAEYQELSAQDQELVTRVMVNAGKAIAAYISELRCGPGRFDEWLEGDDSALDASEIRGAKLFAGDGDCIRCHSGPLLTDGLFHNVGLAPSTVAVAFTDLDDRGAAEALPQLADDPLNTKGPFSDGEREGQEVGVQLEGAFRTPTLRCIADQPSFMHTGQYTSLSEVLSFFNEGGHFFGYLGESEIEPLGLSEQDLEDLESFLRTLQGPGPDKNLLEEP